MSVLLCLLLINSAKPSTVRHICEFTIIVRWSDTICRENILLGNSVRRINVGLDSLVDGRQSILIDFFWIRRMKRRVDHRGQVLDLLLHRGRGRGRVEVGVGVGVVIIVVIVSLLMWRLGIGWRDK